MRSFLATLTRHSEIALIALLVLIMFLMIIPMPFWLVDSLIALNLAISILLATTAIYIRQPLEISTFPAILLISVLFRLALSVTTTRLILTTGSGGNIVTTFGDFVVGGNIVVGIVIFLIITVVQFVVITKGSERIAEVSARFTLDALPGKQLSIDSDLRNGLLTTETAQQARSVLERQSQFYGAMDGATKFVKGDAIAGLVITFVNLIGGLIIGVAQQGLPFGEALAIYSQQTVGDGLVAQIPALFIAIAAGSVVTRVADEKSQNLGHDIGAELVAHPRTLAAVAGVLILFAFVPGFPMAVFAILAIGFVTASIFSQNALLRRGKRSMLPTSDFDSVDAAMGRMQPMTPLRLEIGATIADEIEPERILTVFEQVRETAYARSGLWLAPIGLALGESLEEDSYEILLDEVPRLTGRLPVHHVELIDDPDFATLGDIPSTSHDDLLPDRRVHLVKLEDAARLNALSVASRGAEYLLEEALSHVVAKHGSHFVGLEETKHLLGHFERQYAELVSQVQNVGSIHQISSVLQRLVADGVSIRNLRAIFQGYLEWSKKEQDPILLAEYVRTSIKDQLCQPYIDPDGMMAVLLFRSDVEEVIRESIQETSVGSYLALDGENASLLAERVQTYWHLTKEASAECVLVTSIDIRRYVRNALKLNDIDIPVFSYQDIALDVRIHPLGVIDFDPVGQGI